MTGRRSRLADPLDVTGHTWQESAARIRIISGDWDARDPSTGERSDDARSRRRCPVDGTELVEPWVTPQSESWVPVARSDVVYCTPRCRQAASRARRGLRHGWGGTSERKARRTREPSTVAVTGPAMELGGRTYRQTTARLGR